MMETASFYHDEGRPVKTAVNLLKKSMTLDFASGNKKFKPSLLQSPDLNLLKLASPDLERMIIQANGMVTTTPTPTQFICPKSVTEEQEAYARGFVDALAELHGKPFQDEIPMLPFSPIYTTTTTSLPGSSLLSGSLKRTHAAASRGQPQQSSVITTSRQIQESTQFSIKDEPHVVPDCLLDLSAPVSPINMDNQERIKLERKRARNRVAARKCRTRKLERISRLEDKVKLMKTDNSQLGQSASSLRDELSKLKQTIIEHINSGCQIAMGGTGITI